jgi:hypothetical protein
MPALCHAVLRGAVRRWWERDRRSQVGAERAVARDRVHE